MGRELKRVPLDFDWPQDKPWKGYINPFWNQSIKCPHCDGRGDSPEAQHLEDLWYAHRGGGFKPEDRGSKPYLPTDEVARKWAERQCSRTPEFYGSDEASIHREAVRICGLWNAAWSHHLNEQDVAALIKDGALMDFTHTWTRGKGWRKKRSFKVPTPREVNDHYLFGAGVSAWPVMKAELKRLKQPAECAHCKGHGHTWPSDRVKRQHAAWRRKEPPKGDGYQVWETVSEGSPISPVFATPQELANHMSTTRWGADQGSSPETWLKFILGPGWAPSMMSSPQTGLVSGVEAVVAIKEGRS